MKFEEAYRQWSALLPLSLKDQDRLSRKFTVEFNYNSNHIEGNTLTYGQTELLLLFGKVAGEAQMKDYEEMKASNVGLKMMIEESHEADKPLTQNFIRILHKTLLRSFTVHAGQYKTRPNSVITRYSDRFEYASPQETPALMTNLVDWYNEVEKSGKYSPLELAALFHYRYIRIHPFEDGNGRIARLLANYILSRHGLPMVVVRSRKKQDYLEALHQADLRVGPVPSEGANAGLKAAAPFINWFRKMVTEELWSNVAFVQTHDANVWWYDGEKISFRSPTSSAMLGELTTNPQVTIEGLSKMLGINTSAVQKQLKSMTEKGYISRKENGERHVFITPSDL